MTINREVKFFYDENFQWDSVYKLNYYNLLYNNSTTENIGDYNITLSYDSFDSNVDYIFMIGLSLYKIISKKSTQTTQNNE